MGARGFGSCSLFISLQVHIYTQIEIQREQQETLLPSSRPGNTLVPYPGQHVQQVWRSFLYPLDGQRHIDILSCRTSGRPARECTWFRIASRTSMHWRRVADCAVHDLARPGVPASGGVRGSDHIGFPEAPLHAGFTLARSRFLG